MDIPYRAMLFGCLIEKSYHKIGFCEAKGFIHFAFCILHFAFSSSPINCNLLFSKHLRQNGLRPLVDGGLAVVVNDDHENSPTVILAIAQSLWHRQRDLSIGFLSFFVPNGNLTKKALCGIMFSYGTMPRSGDAEGRVLFPRLFGIFFCVRKN